MEGYSQYDIISDYDSNEKQPEKAYGMRKPLSQTPWAASAGFIGGKKQFNQ